LRNSNVVFDDKNISNEKLINYKVLELFEIYNFHFDGFFKQGHLKSSKIQFQIISTSGFLTKPRVEI